MRLGIADVDRALKQFERVIKRLSRLKTADNAESKKRTGATAQIFLRQRVIRTVGKACIIDPGDTWIAAQKFGGAAPILDMTFDAQRHSLDSLQQQEGRKRRQHGAGGALIHAAAAGDIRRFAEVLGVAPWIERLLGSVREICWSGEASICFS